MHVGEPLASRELGVHQGLSVEALDEARLAVAEPSEHVGERVDGQLLGARATVRIGVQDAHEADAVGA